MIASDKTVANYAAEIWMQAVQDHNDSSELIGTILGKHQQIEFAPLKRFTDLIMSTMLGISPRHNYQLEILLASMLKQLPSEPIKGLKKLLEIYLEVVRLNGSSIVDEEMKKLLEKWKNKEALSKVIKAI